MIELKTRREKKELWTTYFLKVCYENLFKGFNTSKQLILDDGCGGCVVRNFIDKNAQYVGIDITGEQADIISDAKRLPFKDGVFDKVVSIVVIQHVPQDLTCLQEMNRVLKEGGKLLLSLAYKYSLYGAQVRIYNSRYRYYKTYSIKEVRGMLKDCGFAVRDSGFCEFSPPFIRRYPVFIAKPLYTILEKLENGGKAKKIPFGKRFWIIAEKR